MGDVRIYSCKCGYEEELYVGYGLMYNNLDLIRRLIPEEIVEAFDEEYSAGNVLSFGIYNAAARCGDCKRIFTANAFSYRLKNTLGEENESADENADSDTGQDSDTNDGEPPQPREVRYVEECPYCGGVCAEEEDIERIVCPKCKKKMFYKSIGHWD